MIFNNRGYRILKQRTKALDSHAARTDRYIGMSLAEPAVDFQALAAAMGVAARRVHTLDEVRSALAAGIAGAAPNLIEVVMDESF